MPVRLARLSDAGDVWPAAIRVAQLSRRHLLASADDGGIVDGGRIERRRLEQAPEC